jgi:hypothetical protein
MVSLSSSPLRLRTNDLREPSCYTESRDCQYVECRILLSISAIMLITLSKKIVTHAASNSNPTPLNDRSSFLRLGTFSQPQEGFENEAADKMGWPAFRNFILFY